MIEVENLSKRYGEKLAVDGPDFVVQPAIVTGFLGPNGADKSTTMRMIAGLGEPVAPGAPTPWPDDLVKRRIGFSCLARKFVGVHRGQAARAWVLSWAAIRRSRSPRSVRVNLQVNGRAMAL